MRKNDLIKKLQAIKGNPDIVLWNGMVGDWMPIGNLVESYLVKQTQSYYIESCRLEDCSEKKDYTIKYSEDEIECLKKNYKKIFDWESSNYVTQKDIDKGRYTKKSVVYIDAKRRGVNTFDRLGNISY